MPVPPPDESSRSGSGCSGAGSRVPQPLIPPSGIFSPLYHWLFPLELEDLPNSPSPFFALHCFITGTSPAWSGRSHDLHALPGTFGGDPASVLGCPRLGNDGGGIAIASVAVFELRRLR